MPTTTNFGWTTPADTDLVKDGAAAIRTLGNGIDTSLVDLKGGTSGQVLAKNSNTDMDFVWVAQDDLNAIQNAIVDAKGDLVAASGADTPVRLAVGTNEHRLVADSGQTAGLKYVADTTNYAIAAKGDLLVGTAADTLQALSVGTNGHTLVADSSTSTGLAWAAPAGGGGLTLLDTLTLTGSTVTSSSLSGSYKNLLCIYKNVYTSTGDNAYIRINSDTGNNYAYAMVIGTSSASAANEAATSYIRWIDTGNNSGAKQKGTGYLKIFRYTDTDQVAVQSESFVYPGTNVATRNAVAGVYDCSAAITTISFIVGGSTWSGGTVYIYGEE